MVYMSVKQEENKTEVNSVTQKRKNSGEGTLWQMGGGVVVTDLFLMNNVI